MSRQDSIQPGDISRRQAALINTGNNTNGLKIGKRPHDVSFQLFKSFLAQCESFYVNRPAVEIQQQRTAACPGVGE